MRQGWLTWTLCELTLTSINWPSSTVLSEFFVKPLQENGLIQFHKNPWAFIRIFDNFETIKLRRCSKIKGSWAYIFYAQNNNRNFSIAAWLFFHRGSSFCYQNKFKMLLDSFYFFNQISCGEISLWNFIQIGISPAENNMTYQV